MEYRSSSRTPGSRPGSRLLTPTAEDNQKSAKNKPPPAKSTFYLLKQTNVAKQEPESPYTGIFNDRDQVKKI